MIAFGSSIAGADAYRRYAEPGVRRAKEADSPVLAFAAVDSIGRGYNLILDAAAAFDDLEALVIVQPHTEILDPGFCSIVRDAFRDPEVGMVGAMGATGVRSIAWWEGDVVCGDVTHQYEEHHGGELAAMPWLPARRQPPADVEVLDGQLLVLSPWVVRHLRFDEELPFEYGFDVDFSLAVRAAGRRLRVAGLRTRQHRSLELVDNLPLWVEAHVRLAEKWGAMLGVDEGDEEASKRRARQAEARRQAARTIAFSRSLKLDARVQELERTLEACTDTPGWKLTEPLRRLNHWRRERRQAAAAAAAAESRAPAGSQPWR